MSKGANKKKNKKNKHSGAKNQPLRVDNQNKAIDNNQAADQDKVTSQTVSQNQIGKVDNNQAADQDKVASQTVQKNQIVVDGYTQDRGEPIADIKPKSKSFFSRIPATIKALLINWWFSGAVYFFIAWGIPILAEYPIVLTLVLGLVFGLAGDLLINNTLATIIGKDKIQKYVIFHSRSILSALINLVYGVAMGFLISVVYGAINVGAIAIGWAPEKGIWLAGGPILVGTFYAGFNCLFAFLKNLIIKLVQKLKNKTLAE